MCGVKLLKEDLTKKFEVWINVKGYDKNSLEKVLTLVVTIDVLIKNFGEEKLSDDKKLSKIEADIFLLREIKIQ